jgi:hypothetical protein
MGAWMINVRANYGYVRGETNGRKSLTVSRLGSIKRALGFFDWILFLLPGCVAIFLLSAILGVEPYEHPPEYFQAVALMVVTGLFSLLGLYLLYKLYVSDVIVINSDTLAIRGRLFSKADIHSPGFQTETLSMKNIPEKLVDWLASLDIHHVYFYYGCEKRYCVTTLTKPQAEDICAILNAELPLKQANS